MLLEICAYLSLNDAIQAFSSRILVHLGQSDGKFHIIEPCESHFDVIQQRIKPEQIISFTANAHQLLLTMIQEYFRESKEVLSLTLIDLQMLESVSQYGVYFPNLIRLSLRYDNEIGLNVMKNIFRYLPRSIRRLEIHCTRVLCPHYEREQYDMFDISACSLYVTYLLLDLDQFPLISMEECYQEYQTCFLRTLTEFVKHMSWLKYLHLIVNQYDLDNLMNMEQWRGLVFNCRYLRKVKLQILANVADSEILSRKILQWRNQWKEEITNVTL